METSEISFCNKIATNILSEDFKSNLLNKLSNEYGISILNKNCFLLNNKTINNIIKNVHLLSTKTVGNSYYLFLTRINEINYCFYIDKKISKGHKYPRIISVKYRFSDELFDDTLLEGDLVRFNNIKWLFLINDIYIYKKKLLNTINFTNKLDIINELFTKHYVNDPDMAICNLQITKYFHPEHIDTFINEFIPSLPYTCKGIYFTPLIVKHAKMIYLFNQETENLNKKSNKKNYQEVTNDINDSNKKNNNINDEIIDSSNSKKIIHISNISDQSDEEIDNLLVIFKVVKTGKPDIYELLLNNNTEYVFHSHAYLPTLKTSKKISKLFSEIDQLFIFMECEYSSNFDKWIPLNSIDVQAADTVEKVYKITNKLKNI